MCSSVEVKLEKFTENMHQFISILILNSKPTEEYYEVISALWVCGTSRWKPVHNFAYGSHGCKPVHRGCGSLFGKPKPSDEVIWMQIELKKNIWELTVMAITLQYTFSWILSISDGSSMRAFDICDLWTRPENDIKERNMIDYFPVESRGFFRELKQWFCQKMMPY